jgi:hypothetical protein
MINSTLGNQVDNSLVSNAFGFLPRELWATKVTVRSCLLVHWV